MDIDTNIRKKFGLYTGLRSKAEDDRIYDKVYKIAFDEVIIFIEKNLPKDRKVVLEQEMQNLSKSSKEEDQKAKETMSLIYKELQEIPGYYDQIQTRIDEVLDVVLYNAFKDVKSHGAP